MLRKKVRGYVVLSTIGSHRKARVLASALVKERLAACVNIVSGVRSVYIWKNRFCEDREFLLVIKTSKARLNRLIARIEEIHPYELPEVIALPIDVGARKYLRWIEG
ncbi:MAG: divalent-cation tolerance protein CutA [Deltaproteobacteria bacterium]|nr:divalent-cation tolerance protein CutA [Deltaproteobacteria bacterium]